MTRRGSLARRYVHYGIVCLTSPEWKFNFHRLNIYLETWSALDDKFFTRVILNYRDDFGVSRDRDVKVDVRKDRREFSRAKSRRDETGPLSQAARRSRGFVDRKGGRKKKKKKKKRIRLRYNYPALNNNGASTGERTSLTCQLLLEITNFEFRPSPSSLDKSSLTALPDVVNPLIISAVKFYLIELCFKYFNRGIKARANRNKINN
ncbi:hypothetical protein PUN28_014545 [Cardiocondyla obscurior]|uniref:Uncharacterized protein n=1 Tax=Cardiocondyla obscurior TaxID=286306 RepID=A0AAW2F0N6_9HYME